MSKVNGIDSMEYYYLHNKDMVKFKEYFDGYFGYICRKYYRGFKQSTDKFIDLRNETFIFVWNWLEDDNYKIERGGKFVSIIYAVIKWQLSNYFRRLNKQRENEINVDLNDMKNITVDGYDKDMSLNFYMHFINTTIDEYQLTIQKDDAIEYFIHNNDKVQIHIDLTPELKFIGWLLYKKFSNNIIYDREVIQ